MKTKIILAISTIALGTTATFAQAISEECKTTASIAYEHAKVKNYEAAEAPLAKVRKECPTYSVATYQFTGKLLKAKLKKATGDQKKVVANELIAMYKERLQYFPTKSEKGDVYSDIAQLMYDHKIGTKEEQYATFDKAYKEDQANFHGAKKWYTYFSLLVDLHKDGKKELQEVFDMYDVVTEKIEEEESNKAKVISELSAKEEAGATLTKKEARKLKNAEINLKAYSKVKGGVNGKLGVLADCTNLIPLYNGQFDAKKGDIEWVKRATRRMYSKECTDDPLFFKLVESQHKLEPSAKSALYLGRLAEKDKNSAKALEYYNQSAELETNKSDKAKVYYTIASSYKKKGSYGKARAYYNKALQQKPSLGVAYLQIANMIASSANNCGTDVFSKRAVYWLAARYANKAGRVDPSVSSNASKAAANFNAKAPSKSDVFQKGVQGQTIKIGCWIGESIKVPAL